LNPGLMTTAPDGPREDEGEHHQRDVTVPALPTAGFIVREPQFGLGGFEGVLNGPATPLDTDQHRQRRPPRAPCGGSAGLGVALGQMN